MLPFLHFVYPLSFVFGLFGGQLKNNWILCIFLQTNVWYNLVYEHEKVLHHIYYSSSYKIYFLWIHRYFETILLKVKILPINYCNIIILHYWKYLVNAVISAVVIEVVFILSNLQHIIADRTALKHAGRLKWKMEEGYVRLESNQFLEEKFRWGFKNCLC